MSTSTSPQGGQFIINDITPTEVFTPEDFSEEQQMMKAAVQEFIDREVWPHKPRFEKGDYDFTKECMEKAGQLGFLSVGVPEAYGGLDMGFVSVMLVCDYISSVSGSFSTAFGAHTGIGTLPITLYGTEKQKQHYVPKLASGEWFGAYCLTEPGAGSDANSGKTKAVLSEDGTHYLISGQKMWISNAGFANVFTVFARIEEDKNITGFIVPYDPDNGITLGEEEHKLGIHASSTRQVFFNETKVPVENMLSERGAGFKIAMNSLNAGRIKLAAACLDSQRRIITGAVQYANERIQFKTPISQFGAIKEKIARMAASCYVGESASYRAAGDVEAKIESLKAEGRSPQEAELKGLENFAIECSILKIAISEDIQICADEGIQILGGMGFSAETPMEGAWRDARISRIYEGTNEINRMLAVGMLFKKAMKGELDMMSTVMQIGEEVKKGVQNENTSENNALATEHHLTQNFKKVFLMIAGAAVQKFGTDLEKHQQLLTALSDILIETYLSESAVLRTRKNIEKSSEEDQKYPIQMTQYYLYEASEIVSKKGREAIISIATDAEQQSMLAALRDYCNYAQWPNVIELKTSIADKVIAENKYCF